MKRNDILLIIVLIIISMLPLTFKSSYNDSAVIRIKGEVVEKISLDKDTTIKISNSNGYNLIKVSKGTISIIEADCPDKICVKSGKIKKPGEIIACVPHNLIIEIGSN